MTEAADLKVLARDGTQTWLMPGRSAAGHTTTLQQASGAGPHDFKAANSLLRLSLASPKSIMHLVL